MAQNLQPKNTNHFVTRHSVRQHTQHLNARGYDARCCFLKAPAMDVSHRFTNEQLEKVINEGMIYMCACPAQVAQSIRSLREVYAYQQSCLTEPKNDARVHQEIARAAQMAQSVMEDCMDKILDLEKWDRATLTMPAALRKRQVEEI